MADGGGFRFTNDGIEMMPAPGGADAADYGVPGAAYVPAAQPQGHLLQGHLLQNERVPGSGDRLVGWPLLGWLAMLLLAALCATILGLLAAHFATTRDELNEIEQLVRELAGDCANDSVTYCDVLIAGAGPGGVYTAYRLAPHFHVCLVDYRDRIGGKVFTYTNASNPTLWTPTHAEQLRASDTIGRCWYQELGITSWIRATTGSYYEGFIRNRNWTAPVCNFPTGPLLPAVCPQGNAYDTVAPNGFTDRNTFYPSQMLFECYSQDWRFCSYGAQYNPLLLAGPAADDTTWRDYVTSQVGPEGYAYLQDTGIEQDVWREPHSAKWTQDYLKFDGALGYNALYLPDGGPYAALSAALGHILGNGSSLYLGERVTDVQDVSAEDGVYTFEVRTAQHRFRAKRAVLAFPPYFVRDLGGDLGGTLAHDPHVTFGAATSACSWNAFFPNKWWWPVRNQCLDGYCAYYRGFALTSEGRDGVTWSFVDESENGIVEFIQYIPTPARALANLLRVFPTADMCPFLQTILENEGQPAVAKIMMDYIHGRFDYDTNGNPSNVTEPVDYYFDEEPSGYSELNAGVTFDLYAQAAWAARPFAGRQLCLVSEGYATGHSGWQEGAWASAHACLREQYLDTFTAGEIASWEACCNPAGPPTTCGAACVPGSHSTPSTFVEPQLSGCIAADDPNTWAYCNRLSGEMSLRDHYGLCFCDPCIVSEPGSSNNNTNAPTPVPGFEPPPANFTRPIGRSVRRVWE